jgi:SAM-dependent methyltransferase
MYEERLPFADAKYDLVVLHDVFEHLDHKVRMLHILRRYLKPGGVMLITFPPYYSAYGAHQQHLLTWFARLPFVHLVPFGTSAVLPRLRNEYPHVLEEVRKLTRLKMGIAAFERLVSEGGLRIVQVKSYLISPNHVRFGLKPVSAWFFAKVPYLKEVLCSGVVYLLSE